MRAKASPSASMLVNRVQEVISIVTKSKSFSLCVDLAKIRNVLMYV